MASTPEMSEDQALELDRKNAARAARHYRAMQADPDTYDAAWVAARAAYNEATVCDVMAEQARRVVGRRVGR